MLSSTGLGPPMCTSMRESEVLNPKRNPTCRARICWSVRPSRVSAPAISQFCPADWPEKAGSATDRFSLEFR